MFSTFAIQMKLIVHTWIKWKPMDEYTRQNLFTWNIQPKKKISSIFTFLWSNIVYFHKQSRQSRLMKLENINENQFFSFGLFLFFCFFHFCVVMFCCCCSYYIYRNHVNTIIFYFFIFGNMNKSRFVFDFLFFFSILGIVRFHGEKEIKFRESKQCYKYEVVWSYFWLR